MATQECRLHIACDGGPHDESEFYWLARERVYDHSCRRCRRKQQRDRRIAMGQAQSKGDVAHKGFNPLAHAFCCRPRSKPHDR